MSCTMWATRLLTAGGWETRPPMCVVGCNGQLKVCFIQRNRGLKWVFWDFSKILSSGVVWNKTPSERATEEKSYKLSPFRNRYHKRTSGEKSQACVSCVIGVILQLVDGGRCQDHVGHGGGNDALPLVRLRIPLEGDDCCQFLRG